MAGVSMPPALMTLVQGTVSEASAPAVGGGWTGAAAPYSAAQLTSLPRTGPGANPLLTSLFGGGGTTSQGGGGGLIGAVMNSTSQRGPLSGFNPAQMLKNIKSINLGGFARAPGQYGPDAMGNDTWQQGKITGLNGLAGAAAMAGGSMVAERGLLGSGMGTWGGTAEGAAGGAAMGFAMGGPLGAAHRRRWPDWASASVRSWPESNRRR